MKRTNPEKGRDVDPKWVEISWDEALNTITDKLKAVLQKDPRRFIFFTGHRGANVRDPVTRDAFCPAFGTPNSGWYGGGGMYCSGFALHPTGNQMFGTFVFNPNTIHSRLVVSQGSGSEEIGKATPATVRELVELKEKGTKFVLIDPWGGTSGQKADQWIPIRPSSDLAFILAVFNVIVNELGTYDADFLKKRTNAAYLIGPDGFYVRSNDQIADPARLNLKFGKPLVWDPVDNKAKTWDDSTLKDTALTGSYNVNGVQAKPAFQVFKDQVKDNTPEWAEKLTTVPAQTIRDLAKQWVDSAQIGSTIVIDGTTFPYRPVNWSGGRGFHNHQWGYDTHHAEAIVNMLVGAFGVPGGVLGDDQAGGSCVMTKNPVDGVHIPGPTYSRYKSIKFPPQTVSGEELYPVSYKMHPLTWNAVLNQDSSDPADHCYNQYPLEVAMIAGAGIMAGAAQPDTVAAALKKIPFIFALSYQFDEPDQMADIVLPDNTFLERYYIAGATAYTPEAPGAYSNSYDVLRQPVVQQPVFNSRDANDVMIELADRLGILYGKGGVNDRLNSYIGLQDPYKLDLNKKYAWKDIVDLNLKSDNGAQYGLDWFSTNGLKLGKSLSAKEFFPITSKLGQARHPFYNEYMLWVGKQWASELKQYNIKLKPSNDFATGGCHAFPTYNPDPQIGGAKPVPAEYDMWATHGKTMVHSMTNPMSQGWLAEQVQLYDPYTMMICMNPATAKARGLKNGDHVVLESPWGKTSSNLRVTGLIHPEAVGILGCFGYKSTGLPASARIGPHHNELTTLDQQYMASRSVGLENRIRVKVYKA